MADRPAHLRSQILFYILALLWLPAGLVASAAIRFDWPALAAGEWLTMTVMASSSLLVTAACGLPLALACRRLGRVGYPRAAWAAGAILAAATVAATLPAGLLGPPGIIVAALLLSLPAWIAALWLGRRARARARAGAGSPPLDGPDRRP